MPTLPIGLQLCSRVIGEYSTLRGVFTHLLTIWAVVKAGCVRRASAWAISGPGEGWRKQGEPIPEAAGTALGSPRGKSNTDERSEQRSGCSIAESEILSRNGRRGIGFARRVQRPPSPNALPVTLTDGGRLHSNTAPRRERADRSCRMLLRWGALRRTRRPRRIDPGIERRGSVEQIDQAKEVGRTELAAVVNIHAE